MKGTPAFNIGTSSSTFTPVTFRTSVQKCDTLTRPRITYQPGRIRMAEDGGGFFRNPFKARPKPVDESSTSFMEPQPGDPGFKEPAPVAKGAGLPVDKTPPKAKSEETTAKKDTPSKTGGKSATEKKVTPTPAGGKGQKLPVASGTEAVKRGLDLLKEDFLKNAPERAGVGRQDTPSLTIKPSAGEPGYKPQAYQTIYASELGISGFPDDKNFVSKVGGIGAVKKAALDVKKAGKTAKEIKQEVLKIETKKEKTVFDIPDYLKPIPEDTTRKGYTWKNYNGR